MSANLELARAAYDLLVNQKPDGLTRIALMSALKTDDRSARDAVNACRVLAAELPHPKTGKVFVIGYDPETGRYCAAQDAYTARRITAYQESRVLDINWALSAQKRAFERTFRQSYQSAEQRRLL